MRAIRRLLQVVAIVGTLMIGVVALALIVSQTSWFRDWLRRYIVRESKQYLNGELSIGGLNGNLLFGVNLHDVAVDVSGERVVAVKGLVVDYSVLELVSKGIVLNELKLVEPKLVLERGRDGWNIARLVKRQEAEADRQGPGRPVTLESIEIADGRINIHDAVGTSGYRLPDSIQDLDVKAAFAYAPVHYSLEIDHVSFRGQGPQLDVRDLHGGIAVREDNLYVERLALQTAESSLTIDGVIEKYLQTPVVKVTTTGKVSLPEIGRVVPAAAGYALHPSIDVKADGPAERLAMALNVQSEAGAVRGQITADVKAPDLAVRGAVDVERLNLAPILKNPAQRSDLTGHATIDLRMASNPADAPVTDRLHGTFAFAGPRVVAAGYTASNVKVTGTIAGPRLTIDGRAAAYGGTATAAGVIILPAANAPVAFDLHGTADHVNLRGLPASTGAPAVDSNLSVAEYRIQGRGRSVTGSARLHASDLEGARIGDGTTAEFSTTHGAVSYAAKGSVAHLNLQRIGHAFKIAALDRPEYDSVVNAQFDVKGFGTKPDVMKLDAVGSLSDTAIMGATIPQLNFETHLDAGALTARADGRFEHLDPARVSGRQQLAGEVSGTVNANMRLADISAPITPESIVADGHIAVANSIVGGLRITEAAVDGRYVNQVGDLTRLHVASPDLKVDASGRLALDRSSSSNLKYLVEATNVAELGRLAGQEGLGGSAVLEGAVTGNASSLQVTGKLNGSGLAYQQNSALDLNSQYTVTVPDLQFANARVEATTGATFVAAAGMQINQLTAKTTYAQKQLEFTTNIKERTRELDATGLVIFHPDHQEIHLPQLALRTQGVEWRTAPGSAAAIQYGQNRIELQNVRLISGDQALDASGAFPLKADAAPGTIEVHASNVDLAQTERLLLQNRGLTGRLTANATITGTPAKPSVAGHVEIHNGAFQTYKYESLVADVDYQGMRIGLDAKLQQSAAESITARGSVPTTLFAKSAAGHIPPSGEDRIDLHVQSTPINLGIVQGFTNQITNVTGTLQADVHVMGSGEDPHLQGYVDIKGGAFGVPAGGVSYTGLDTRIELTPDAVRIQQFKIVDEEGQIATIAGELGVHEKQVGAVDVAINADDFELIDNELGDVGVNTQLKITGELRRPRIVGDVRLQSARLEVDKILELFYSPYSVQAIPDVVSAERTVEGSGSAQEATKEALSRAEVSAAPPGAQARAGENAPPVPGGAFAPVALDVHLRIPENLVLRGKNLRPGGPTGAALGDMNITVGGDLRIRKEPGEPVLLIGDVGTVRGTYQFQGRRFDLVRGGTVRFVGDPQINPILDVTATRTIPNTGVEARIHITGTARTPELHLSSEPPLDESDILALIVFNRPVNELGSGERASLAATAGGIATGFIAAPLGESIGRALDLDLFEITTTTDQGDLGAGLTVGQQIGDRAFFKLRQQFGARNLTEFLLEFQLADFLRLQLSGAPETTGSANRVGQRRVERAGIDLIFFFSY